MKKRLRKKISKREMCVVIYGISIDGFWRKRLFDSPVCKKYPINIDNANILPEEVLNLLRRYRMSYNVWRAEKTPDNLYEIFEFQSEEFPTITDYSLNNPNVIGKSPFLSNSNEGEISST
jgi:hypothetical protein